MWAWSQRVSPVARGHAEQHGLAVRQQLRAVHLFALLRPNDEFRRAAVRRHAHDAVGLTEENRVVALPADAKRISSRTNDHRRPAADG